MLNPMRDKYECTYRGREGKSPVTTGLSRRSHRVKPPTRTSQAWKVEAVMKKKGVPGEHFHVIHHLSHSSLSLSPKILKCTSFREYISIGNVARLLWSIMAIDKHGSTFSWPTMANDRLASWSRFRGRQQCTRSCGHRQARVWGRQRPSV